MEAIAKLQNVPMSPRKMRLVVDNIRGKNVGDALDMLKYTNKEAATWLDKLVRSAVANWAVKSEVDADDFDLFVKTIFVTQAGMAKRFQPAPHGRAHRIRKRSNHVTLVVENRHPLESELEPQTDETTTTA